MHYFPAITTREAETRALSRLAGPTKDLLFPIVRVQAWPRLKASSPHLVQRSLDEYLGAMGERPAALDLSIPRTDLESDVAEQGRLEIRRLHDPALGFRAWTDLLAGRPSFVPTLLWSSDTASMLQQLDVLAGFGRGLALRLKRSQAWNFGQLNEISSVSLADVPVLLVLDCEQIARTEDITATAQQVQNIALAARQAVQSDLVTLVLVGSSFPSDFASIDPLRARLQIRERQLHNLLRENPPMLAAGIDLRYGDHASVFAAERLPTFRGRPRVDYPSPLAWVYQRRTAEEGFGVAAQAVMAEGDWDEDLLCWGAQEIRRAASGDLAGLGAASPWTAIRLNIHLHQQANFGSGAGGPVEEPWIE